MREFYVYFHINPFTNTIFYIGKGKNKRAYLKSGRSKEWHKIVNKYGYIINIVERDLLEDEAFVKEKSYIQRFKSDNLVNKTSGGEGPSGRIPWNKGKNISDEQKAQISKKLKGRSISKEHREKLSKAGKGNKRSLGRKYSKDTKEKISKALMGNKNGIGYIHTDEAREKISQAGYMRKKNKF